MYCYGPFKNPGILSLVDAYATGNFDVKCFPDIVKFSKTFKVDFAIIGPEKPLVDGLVDVLQTHSIPSIGPCKSLAKLEGSKSYTRSLLEVSRNFGSLYLLTRF